MNGGTGSKRAVGDVLHAVVERGWCSGCGVCAAACPADALAMAPDAEAALVPHDVGGCTACGRCIAVCPFGPHGPDEDALAAQRFADAPRHGGIGHARACAAGFAATERAHGASGGLATWTGVRLLESGAVDAVLAVGPVADGRMFAYRACSDVAALRACSGSHYHQASLDEALRAAVRARSRVAVVGVPCTIKALRRAASEWPALAACLGPCLGLACGQQKTHAFTALLAQRAGVPHEASVRTVRYRIKRDGVPPHRFGVEVGYATGAATATASGEFPFDAWVPRVFTLGACEWCDDLAAETADVTFMDAWVEPYLSEPRGTSIAIVRSAEMAALLEAGVADGSVSLEALAPDAVRVSQAAGLSYKSTGLADRLWRAAGSGMAAPRKRIAPGRDRRILRSLANRLVSDVARASRRSFALTGDAEAAFRATTIRRMVASIARSLDARLPSRGRTS